MVDAGARIGIAAADRVPPIDPIERGKRRAREIIDQKTIRRHGDGVRGDERDGDSGVSA